MEIKETVSQTFREVAMLEDLEYFKYIFKKTEKIACAVFYMMRSNSYIRQNDVVVEDVEMSARELLDVSVESLRSTMVSIEEDADELKHMLIRLESKLRIAHAARVLSSDFLEVFIHEIDSVQRSLKRYAEPLVTNPLSTSIKSTEGIRERRPTRSKGELPSAQDSEGRVVQIQSRRERVLNVLRDKGEATIKDIIEVVTDVSEKTIQRELISLIKDSLVHREGERRWSKYKLI